MYKNIALVVLAVCCAYLLYARSADRAALEVAEISPAEYGGLAALRDVLPQEQYRIVVMPYLQEALADGKMTRGELRELGKRLNDLGNLSLTASQKVRPQDALAQALDKSVQGAADLGNQLSRSLSETLDELTRKMDDAIRSLPGQGQQNSPQTVPPAQI